MANRSQVFHLAHELTRRELKRAGGMEFYGSYRKAFGEMIKAIYASERYERDCDAKYGVGMRPGFQVVEPAHLWA